MRGVGKGQRSQERKAIRADPLLAAGAVTWVMVVVTAYFAVHKPASPSQLLALGRALATLAGLAATLCLATALGRPWSPLLTSLPVRTRLALQLGLGLAGLSYLMLILGSLGGLRPLVAWGIAAVGLALGLPQLVRELRHAVPRLPRSPADRALAGFVIALLGLAALRGLAPPTAWDSLVYHLTGPKLYLQAGALHHNLDLPYLGFPPAGSLLFTWGMLLSGDRLPQWIHLTFAVLTLSLLSQALPTAGRGWLAAALLLGVPTAYLLAGAAYVEWLVMFAALASFMLLDQIPSARRQPSGEVGRRVDPRDARILLAAGLMAALALNGKYTAIWMVAGLAAVVALRTRALPCVAIFLGAVVAGVLPFLIKNTVLTGNPVYPFFFSGKLWDAERALWYSRPGTGLDALQLLIAPWEATVWGVEGGVYLGHPSYGASVGPLLLALAPASLLIWRRPERRGRLSALLVVSGFGYLGWLAQLGFSRLLVQTRLLFPVLPFLAVLAAAGFEAIGGLSRWGRSARFVVGGLIALALSLVGLQAALGLASTATLQVVSGGQSETAYLRSTLGQYALAMESLQSLPPQSKVAFLWEPRSYSCPASIECQPDALTDRWWHERRRGLDAAAVAAQWKGQGVTHVLFSAIGAQAIQEAGVDPYQAEDWAELDRFLEGQLVPAASFGDAYTLYAWR
jgi:hypothetical protein